MSFRNNGTTFEKVVWVKSSAKSFVWDFGFRFQVFPVSRVKQVWKWKSFCGLWFLTLLNNGQWTFDHFWAAFISCFWANFEQQTSFPRCWMSWAKSSRIFYLGIFRKSRKNLQNWWGHSHNQLNLRTLNLALGLFFPLSTSQWFVLFFSIYPAQNSSKRKLDWES